MEFIETRNHYGRLIAAGAKVVKAPEFYQSRAKVSGYMWDGWATLTLGGRLFTLKLWSHMGDNETLETVLPEFVVGSIQSKKGAAYYTSWNWIFSTTGIWLHRKGWFDNDELREKIKHLEGNSNCRLAVLGPEDEELLRNEGFKKISW